MLLFPAAETAAGGRQSRAAMVQISKRNRFMWIHAPFLVKVVKNTAAFLQGVVCMSLRALYTMRFRHYAAASFVRFIPACNEPSAALARAFGECREGQIPRSLLRGI